MSQTAAPICPGFDQRLWRPGRTVIRKAQRELYVMWPRNGELWQPFTFRPQALTVPMTHEGKNECKKSGPVVPIVQECERIIIPASCAEIGSRNSDSLT